MESSDCSATHKAAPLILNEKDGVLYDFDSRPSTPGLGPRDAYDSLSWWRAALRNRLLVDMEWQSTAIANMQVRGRPVLRLKFPVDLSTQARIRTPLLDRYFVYTSSLGTHTFFMTFLPMCFFFGFDQFGRGYAAVIDNHL